MPKRFFPACTLALILFTRLPAATTENWPGFRGPRGDGTSLEAGLPDRWTSGSGLAWKVELPGRGHASPVVWNDRIFVVSALEAEQERILACLDRATGRTLWQRTVLRSPLERIHSLNSYASSTPLTDGERVYVSFLDREQMFIAAYDFQGREVWKARPGPFKSIHGYSSSPILYKNTVIVNGDHDGDGFLVALNRRTGTVVWRVPRPNNTRSYCTPLIRTVAGKPHMMLSGSKCVASYDPDTGALQWMLDGPTEQFVAAPVYNGRYLSSPPGTQKGTSWRSARRIRPPRDASCGGRGGAAPTSRRRCFRRSTCCRSRTAGSSPASWRTRVSCYGVSAWVEGIAHRRCWPTARPTSSAIGA